MNIQSMIRAVLVVAFATATSAMALAQQRPAAAQKVDFGKAEYEDKCATCHGVKGAGDGPTAPFLTKRAADLTTLAKKNNGILPVAAIYEVVEGGKEASVHGTRDMPVWGKAYRIQAAEYYIDVPYDPEAYVRARILAVVEYINRLQAK
jgi:mono/diheme cytochrome c family protein